MRRALLIGLLALGGCGGQEAKQPTATPAATAGHVIAADDAGFERVLEDAPGPVLVLFWAPWATPSKIPMGYLEAAARERPGLTAVSVDTDVAPKTAERYEVMSIPTAIVLVDGKPRGEPVAGAAPQKTWEGRLGLDEIAPRR